MTAFFVATVKVNNPEKFQEYAQKAAKTFAAHGGEPVLRGKVNEVLAGQSNHQAVGIVRFPDQDALTAWFHSDAYQAIVPLRDQAADMVIVTYSIPA